MLKATVSSVVCLGLLAGAAEGTAQVLPADRTTVWNAGVAGGIPNRTTRCAAVDAATYGSGAQKTPLPNLGGGPRELVTFIGAFKPGDVRAHILIKPSDA